MESILIIDDDVELCRMLDDYLTPHDIRLSMMHHAADGMDAVRRGGFNLLILDVMLPGLDGFAVLRAIRQWSDIGVLLLTAMREDSDRSWVLNPVRTTICQNPLTPGSFWRVSG
jgi:two-component system response regulator CpxR